MTVDISYSTLEDSVFFKGMRKIKLEDPGFPGSVFSCFMKLRSDDSASFIFKTNDFFVKNLRTPIPYFIKDHEMIKMNVSVTELQKSDEFFMEKKQFLAWSNTLSASENDIISRFLREERINIEPTPSGLYFILLKVGSGRKPVKGDIVTVNYEGKFLNGKYFDSTVKRNEPLEFVYGEEYIVIRGMEEAIGMMREGERTLIIVPSNLAFGSAGAGRGIIPPYTALIYELELLKVRKKPEFKNQND